MAMFEQYQLNAGWFYSIAAFKNAGKTHKLNFIQMPNKMFSTTLNLEVS